MANLYKNQLDELLTNPQGYANTPGFQVGLDATNRKLAAGGMAGSGNALAELFDYGMKNYGDSVDRLGRLAANENQFNLGTDQNANTATANSNTAQRNAWDYQLGLGQNANAADANYNTSQNNWWNYDVNKEQNANTAARNANDFSVNSGRNAIDWYGANTQRGAARSNAYNQGQNTDLNWMKYANPGFGIR